MKEIIYKHSDKTFEKEEKNKNEDRYIHDIEVIVTKENNVILITTVICSFSNKTSHGPFYNYHNENVFYLNQTFEDSFDYETQSEAINFAVANKEEFIKKALMRFGEQTK